MKRKLRHVHFGNTISKRALLEKPHRMTEPSRPDAVAFNVPDIIVYEKPAHYICLSQKVGTNTTDRIHTVASSIDSMLRNIGTAFVFDARHAQWTGVTNSQHQTLFGIRLWGQCGDLILEMNYTSGDVSEFIQLQLFIMNNVL